MTARFIYSAFLACTTAAFAAGGEVGFNRDIRPIFSDTCFACHGYDAKMRKAELRLDIPEGAYTKRTNGVTPIVAGDPAKSEIWKRLISDDPKKVMPPPEFHKTISDAQKSTIKKWIEQGAHYQKHWAFEPPVKVSVPQVDERVSTPVDGFVAAKLKAEGMKFSPEAKREVLIRRVSFALTGLPPTRAEVDEFLADKSSDAYEKMVERYLASPRYGEEMARHWLDKARYADTHGLHFDNEREMWAYRDWVIGAFNENESFDQFTIDQLAADLLPNPTKKQLTATGLNRCNETTNEGGVIQEEFLFRYAIDRATVMGETWLGLTVGCAQCHDHKFDPISTKEFYSLYSFFYSGTDPVMDGNAKRVNPIIRISTPEQDQKLAALDASIAAKQKDLETKAMAFGYSDPAASGTNSSANSAKSGTANNKADDPKHSLLAWRKSVAGKAANPLPQAVKNIVRANPEKELNAEEERIVLAYYLGNVCIDSKQQLGSIATEIADITKERDALNNDMPATFVFNEMPKPRDTFVMIRGQYDVKGDKVVPGTPSVLPAMKLADTNARASRLDLAKWLVSPDNPLTARVTVNHFWQQFFGIGLVKTSADFGSQGEMPVNPELLDWLAVTFRESGWDVKALVRLLVNSTAFRQASHMTGEQYERDPENRLLARGPRFRLGAEEIRDNALFVSGLMDFTMGGRGVKTYQPPNIWEPVGYIDSNTRNYKQDSGSALYRRSIYCFLKRTAPPPFMANFDAPSREQFCARRDRSNTPLQALQTMNDVQHFEAARALAERMISEGGTTPDERITFAYRTILGRTPGADELHIVTDEFNAHKKEFEQDVEAAKKAIAAGESKPKLADQPIEVAAYTMVANMLLNLDETLNRN